MLSCHPTWTGSSPLVRREGERKEGREREISDGEGGEGRNKGGREEKCEEKRREEGRDGSHGQNCVFIPIDSS